MMLTMAFFSFWYKIPQWPRFDWNTNSVIHFFIHFMSCLINFWKSNIFMWKRIEFNEFEENEGKKGQSRLWKWEWKVISHENDATWRSGVKESRNVSSVFSFQCPLLKSLFVQSNSYAKKLKFHVQQKMILAVVNKGLKSWCNSYGKSQKQKKITLRLTRICTHNADCFDPCLSVIYPSGVFSVKFEENNMR